MGEVHFFSEPLIQPHLRFIQTIPSPMNKKQIHEKFDRVAMRKLELTTISSYRFWINGYLEFLTTKAASLELTSESKFELYLSNMARDDYSESSQHQAFCAILFLYRHVFQVDLKEVDALRCKRKAKARYTPTEAEMLAILHHLLDRGESINRVGEAMGHTDIRTTAGYGRKDCEGMASPLDRIIAFPKSA